MTSSPRTAVPAPRWVTFFNPIAKTLLSVGVPLGYNALLTIRGRRSGEPRTTPIAIMGVAGCGHPSARCTGSRTSGPPAARR